jgi:hypothetical protein
MCCLTYSYQPLDLWGLQNLNKSLLNFKLSLLIESITEIPQIILLDRVFRIIQTILLEKLYVQYINHRSCRYD